MQRISHSTGVANNIIEPNLVDIELDAGSVAGNLTSYSINGITTTLNSKLVQVYTNITNPPVSVGQYIVISFLTSLSNIDPDEINGVRKVLAITGFDNNLLTIEADTEASATGNATLGAGSKTFTIKPILSVMNNNTIRFYVTSDGASRYLNVRYHENGIDYTKDIVLLDV